jgi:uncharacterized protein YjbJ (UPF0337 family)
LEPENERTTGGLIGKAIGKAKAAIGDLRGDHELAREGRLQQAQSDLERDARETAARASRKEAAADTRRQEAENDRERASLETAIADDDKRRRVEQDRETEQRDAEMRTAHRKAEIGTQREAEHDAADSEEHRADRAQVAAAEHAVALQREAHRADQHADEIDPEEER